MQLADGKARTLEHMMMTTFYDQSGRPISSKEYLVQLAGDLPALFTSEEELRRLWSDPRTRKQLLETLEEKGYGGHSLNEFAACVRAEKSDIYDVLAYVAYNTPVVTREARVATHRSKILSFYTDKEREFLEFILKQYEKVGVRELDVDKLPNLIALKYDTPHDARDRLGEMSHIREVFVGFQKHLYDTAVA